jgi:hypothetical protein
MGVTKIVSGGQTGVDRAIVDRHALREVGLHIHFTDRDKFIALRSPCFA